MIASISNLSRTKLCRALQVFTASAATLFLCAPLGITQQKLDGEAVIGHLNAIIKLYRNASAEFQAGGAPSDVIYQENAQSLSAEAVRLAFQAARAEAAAIRATEKSGTPNATAGQSSAQVESRNNARIADMQSKIDELDKQLQVGAQSKARCAARTKAGIAGRIDFG